MSNVTRGERVRLEFVVWNAEGDTWTFKGYGRFDGTEQTWAEHKALILKRVPELEIVADVQDAWDYSYSIVR